MTTLPEQQPLDDANIPRWFHEFVRDNAAQHADLADRIAQSELRTTEKIAQSELRMTEQIAQSELRMTEQIAQSELHMTEQTGQLRLEMAEKIAQSEQRTQRLVLIVAGAGFAGMAALMTTLALLLS